MNKLIVTCILTCTLSFTGCGYKQYEVPSIVDFGLPSDEIIQQYQIDKEWWKNYNDPQLDKLLNLALKNNFQIQNALATLKDAWITIKINEGNFIPSTTSSVSIEGNHPLSSSVSNPNPFAGSYNTGLSLDLSFWNSIPSLEASEWIAKASEEDLESVRLAVAFGLIDAYFTLMYHYNLYNLQLENTSFLEQVFATATYKQQVGRVDGLEPLTAQQALNSAQEKVIQTRTNINNTLALIRDFLNVNHTEKIDIKPVDIIAQKAIEVDLDIPLETLSLRPDIRSAEYLAYSSLHQLKKSHRAWMPTVSILSSLSSNGDLNAKKTTPFLDPASFALGGAVNIGLPFLSWWNIKWEVKTSENNMEKSLFAFTATINQALNQVQALYYSYQNEKLIFALAKEKTIIDVGIFKYRENRYNEGRDDLKTWLEANTNSNNSLENFVLAKLKLIRRENSVFQAMGGRINEKEASAHDLKKQTTTNKKQTTPTAKTTNKKQTTNNVTKLSQ